MIKIEHPVFPSPEQWMFAIEGARNAYDSWHLSDSHIGHTTESVSYTHLTLPTILRV